MSASLIPCIKATEIQGAGYCNSVCVIIVNAVPVSFPVHHKYAHTPQTKMIRRLIQKEWNNIGKETRKWFRESIKGRGNERRINKGIEDRHKGKGNKKTIKRTGEERKR